MVAFGRGVSERCRGCSARPNRFPGDLRHLSSVPPRRSRAIVNQSLRQGGLIHTPVAGGLGPPPWAWRVLERLSLPWSSLYRAGRYSSTLYLLQGNSLISTSTASGIEAVVVRGTSAVLKIISIQHEKCIGFCHEPFLFWHC